MTTGQMQLSCIHIPSGLPFSNIVSVGASNNNNVKAPFSLLLFDFSCRLKAEGWWILEDAI